MQPFQPPSSVLPRAPPPSPVDATPKRKVGIMKMDWTLYLFLITMVDPVLSVLKAAAVGGIFIIWSNFTIEAFRFSWHIISTSPKKDTYVPVFKAVCEKCQKIYDDDEHHLINGAQLCEACRWIEKNNLSIYHVWQQTCENNPCPRNSYRHFRWHWLGCKKGRERNFTPDPSSNVMNYAKFTAVMAGSIALKKYLEDQKILTD